MSWLWIVNKSVNRTHVEPSHYAQTGTLGMQPTLEAWFCTYKPVWTIFFIGAIQAQTPLPYVNILF